MVNVNKMDKFYEDANDQHVRSTFVYKNTRDDTDFWVYADKEFATKIDAVTLKNLFLKGEIVLNAGLGCMTRPVSMFEVDGGAVVLLFLAANGNTTMLGSSECTDDMLEGFTNS